MAWSLIPTLKNPPSRSGAGIAYDNNALYLWGGFTGDTNLYRLNLSSYFWETLNTTGSGPTSRKLFPYFFIENYFYVFPGHKTDMSDISTGTYRINLTSLVWETNVSRINNIVHSFTSIDSRLFLFGGLSSSGISNQLIVGYAGSSIEFETVSSYWLSPKPRLGHSLHKSRTYLWLFGGRSKGTL